MAKNNKSKQGKAQQDLQKKADRVMREPTCYVFNFKDTPKEKYMEALDVLFHDPDFKKMVDGRNNLVGMASRLRGGTPEMMNLVRQIQQRDKKLADLVYAILVQTNIRSDVTYDFLSFKHLVQYFVDYTKPGMGEEVEKLSANLDKLTFLADMLESLLTDVKAEMRTVFGGSIEFNQFDAVAQVLQQLRGYFLSARSKDNDSKEAQLYYEYSDSINEYMEKRLKTYSDKYRKLKPLSPTYTPEQMVEAINFFFGSGSQFGINFIHRTENGGAYIDAVALAFNLSRSQSEKLDKLMEAGKCKVEADKDPQNYCLQVTDAIMLYYQMKGKKVKK